MPTKTILFIFSLFLISNCYAISTKAATVRRRTKLQSRPVIGILSQPAPLPHDNTQYDYIAASYVKWVESAGARSIVIPYDSNEELLHEIFSQINGVLFPGGNSPLPPHADIIWKYIKERNAKENDYFPVWGTCLGFEFIVMLSGGKSDDIVETLQSGFDSENISLPLLFPSEQDVIDSNGVYSASSQLYPLLTSTRTTVATTNITMNNHHMGIEPNHFMNNENLTNMFHITSTNYDRNGRPFVSTIEAKDYPIYGTQYHPEKNNFEFGLMHHVGGSSTGNSPSVGYYSDEPYESINHSIEAVELSMTLALFFIGQVRRSTSGTYGLVKRHPTIYHYPMELGKSFEQIFLIPKAGHWYNDDTSNDFETNSSDASNVTTGTLKMVSFLLLCVVSLFVSLRRRHFGLKYAQKHYYHIPENTTASLEMLVE
jgi:gamma-glutamyl hydrolase